MNGSSSLPLVSLSSLTMVAAITGVARDGADGSGNWSLLRVDDSTKVASTA